MLSIFAQHLMKIISILKIHLSKEYFQMNGFYKKKLPLNINCMISRNDSICFSSLAKSVNSEDEFSMFI